MKPSCSWCAGSVWDGIHRGLCILIPFMSAEETTEFSEAPRSPLLLHILPFTPRAFSDHLERIWKTGENSLFPMEMCLVSPSPAQAGSARVFLRLDGTLAAYVTQPWVRLLE